MPSYTSYIRQMAVMDADDDIQWITVKGNHIPIKKGQSKEDAVKSFFEHQAGKNDVPQGVKWTPTNKKGEGTGNKKVEKKEKYNIQHGAKISDIESMINAHADKKEYKSWKEEEEYVAEKLKEEGIYAYRNQIKEAMKNVYGDVYEQERREEKAESKSAPKKIDSYQIKQGDFISFTPDGRKYEVLGFTSGGLTGLIDVKSRKRIDRKIRLTETVYKYTKGVEKMVDTEKLEKKESAPKVKRVDAKKWNSPASDPWKSLYD